jgi:hypothetical protein
MQDKKVKLESAWTPPPIDTLKINLDGAFSQEERKDGWGFIVRDHDGLAMLAAIGRIFFLHDAFSAEIHGCLAALSTAIDQGMSHIIQNQTQQFLYGPFRLMTMISRLSVFSLEKQNFLCL